jgi:hypothetical protein
MVTEEELVYQMASIAIADTRRQSNRMAFPAAALVVDFEKLACRIMGKRCDGAARTSLGIRNRRILSFFGVPALVMAKLWELLMEHGGPWPHLTRKKHLLWALHLKKVHSTETVLASNVGCADEKNFRTWAWLFIEELACSEFHVVSE